MGISFHHIKEIKQDATTLKEARERLLAAAKAAAEAGRHDAFEISLPSGWYSVTEPFVLSTKENPELASLDITIRSPHRGLAYFHSLVRVPGAEFEKVEGAPYFKYCFPKDEEGKAPLFHDLFLNGPRIEMSKSPVWHNPLPFSPEERAGEAKCPGFYVPYEIAEQLAGGELGATELVIYIEWEFAVLHVTGVDLSAVREFEGVKHALVTVKQEELDFLATSCHRSLNVGRRETFFRNSPAFLTEEDTYAYDYAKGELYLLPRDTVHMPYHLVQYPTLENLLRLEGLTNCTLDGVAFMGTTSKTVCRDIYYSGQANTLYGAGKLDDCARGRVRHSAVFTASMRNFTVKNCVFRNLGGNGLQMTDDSTKINIHSNIFENISMSALSIGNPTTEWENPQNRNITVKVHNNYFHHIAYDYPTALCVYVGTVDGLKIHRNTVDGCGYSAISVGWGWCYVPYELGEKVNVRDADIAFNRFRNFMDVLRDGAAIYVVGANCHVSNTTRFNVMHDNYAELDERRDTSKRGYYCDGSTSNWEVRHSVIINCALPLFSQFHYEPAGTHHNTLHDVYSTTPIDKGNHAPHRDTILGENYVVEGTAEDLFAAYPVAREIRDASGCDLAII